VFKHWEPAYLDAMQQVNSNSLEDLLKEAVPTSPMFSAAFRQAAEMSLLLTRSFKRMPAWQKRMRTQVLLREALPYAQQFPLISDAIRECLIEQLDAPRVKHVLKEIEAGRIGLTIRESVAPSPFAAQFFFDFVNQAMYESDALGKDLKLQMLSVSRELAEELFGKEILRDTVSPSVVSEVRLRTEEASEVELTDEDGVYLFFKQRGDLAAEQWHRIAARHAYAEKIFTELLAEGRLIEVHIGGETRYICGDEREIYESIAVAAESLHFVLSRFIGTQLAFTSRMLSERYHLSLQRVEGVIAEWVSEGRIVVAPFAVEGEKGLLWTEAKLSSRMIRATLNEHRERIEPVSPETYCAHLLARQHVTPGTRRQGSDGLREVLGQLQGIFLPWSQWEASVLPSRLTDYRKEDLDLLCASGEIFWLGKREEGDAEGRIAFFAYEAKELYVPVLERRQRTNAVRQPSHPELLQLVQSRGASFLTALSRETGDAPSALTAKLMDLVWEGHVSNDQFAPVRLASSAASTSRSARTPSLGRWFAADTLVGNGMSGGLPEERCAVTWVQQLFRLNGLVTRPMIAEYSPYSWDMMLEVLRRLEDWGAAVRGFPVQAMPCVQFAPGEWLETMRSPLAASEVQGVTLVASTDPANPYGQWLDWPDHSTASFARRPGNFLLFRDGKWLLWIENKGRKIVEMTSQDNTSRSDDLTDCLKSVAQALLRQPGIRKVVVDRWNGHKAAESEAADVLLRIGAEADRGSLVLWPSSLRSS
jgi:ATP-dependent helicase Lhr and Lhr-like helicase